MGTLVHGSVDPVAATGVTMYVSWRKISAILAIVLLMIWRLVHLNKDGECPGQDRATKWQAEENSAYIDEPSGAWNTLRLPDGEEKAATKTLNMHVGINGAVRVKGRG